MSYEKILAFGVWLDTPAGGEFFWSVLFLFAFLLFITKGARRG